MKKKSHVLVAAVEAESPKLDHRNLRLDMSGMESGMIHRCAIRYNMKPSVYVRACLEEDGPLVSLPEPGPKDQHLTIRIPNELYGNVKTAAVHAGHLKVAEYVRRRAMGGLKRKPNSRAGILSKGGVRRRGRPRWEDYLMDYAAGDRLVALTTDTSMMQEIICEMFKLLSRAGVKPGDVNTLLEICKRIYKVETIETQFGRSRDPHEPAPVERSLSVKVWTPTGLVEAREPTVDAKRARNAGRFFDAQQGSEPG